MRIKLADGLSRWRHPAPWPEEGIGPVTAVCLLRFGKHQLSWRVAHRFHKGADVIDVHVNANVPAFLLVHLHEMPPVFPEDELPVPSGERWPFETIHNVTRRECD